MLRNTTRLTLFIAPMALAALIFSAQAGAQKKPPAPVNNASLNVTLSSSPTMVTACSDSGTQQVQLNAAVSQTDNPVKYRWTTTGGTITGDGPVVTWNLAGVKPGYHKASLDVETSGSGGTCQAFSSVSVLVNPCAPVRPVCPAIEVTCPTAVGIDQPLTFTSRSTGGTPSVTPAYNWTVSAGTITAGQGTDTITVDTTGLAGQTVRASLSMGGYNLDCAADCVVSIPVPKYESRRFDEFPDIARNDEKARLDNFAIELQNDPKSTAYVIVYPGKTGKRGEVQYHANRVVDYLVNSRGIDKSRIVTLVGPKRDQLNVDLWITPQGATAPKP
jgi:hypothetical protein